MSGQASSPQVLQRERSFASSEKLGLATPHTKRTIHRLRRQRKDTSHTHTRTHTHTRARARRRHNGLTRLAFAPGGTHPMRSHQPLASTPTPWGGAATGPSSDLASTIAESMFWWAARARLERWSCFVAESLSLLLVVFEIC